MCKKELFDHVRECYTNVTARLMIYAEEVKVKIPTAREAVTRVGFNYRGFQAPQENPQSLSCACIIATTTCCIPLS